MQPISMLVIYTGVSFCESKWCKLASGSTHSSKSTARKSQHVFLAASCGPGSRDAHVERNAAR